MSYSPRVARGPGYRWTQKISCPRLMLHCHQCGC